MTKKEYHAAYYRANRDRLRAAAHAYYEAHKEEYALQGKLLRLRKMAEDPDRMRELARKRMAAWRARNPERARAKARELRLRNPEKARELGRKHYAANRDKRNEQTKRSRKKHKEKWDAYMREYSLKKKFGITQAQFDRMLAEQNGTCALCDSTSSGKQNGRARRLAVDHNHTTRQLRGLLCTQCNAAIERLETVQDWHEKALRYLAHYAEKAVSPCVA